MSDRGSVEQDLTAARRRAWALTPYSPAWDAAMTLVEDLERALWTLDHPGFASGKEHSHQSDFLERVPA